MIPSAMRMEMIATNNVKLNETTTCEQRDQMGSTIMDAVVFSCIQPYSDVFPKTWKTQIVYIFSVKGQAKKWDAKCVQGLCDMFIEVYRT